MAFNHRKLSLICEFSCDSIRNPNGTCLIPCVPLCPSVCIPPFIPLTAIPPPDPPPPAANAAASGGHPVNKLHLLLIISLSTLAAACFAFCCFTFYKFYKSRQISRRRRSPQQLQDEGTHDVFLNADHGPVLDHPIWYIRTVGLQPHLINAITVFKYKRGDGLVEGTECSVCLNEFQDDETLRLLPKCNHAFHVPCIDTWLRSHTNCPLCRAGIVSNAAAASFPGPVPEQSVDHPVAVEEAPVVVIQESSGELTRERDDPGSEEENETRVENGGNGPETLKEEAAVDEVQPMRRSVSLDSLSASMISAAMANAHLRESAGDYSSATHLEKGKELNTSIVRKKVDVNQGLTRLVGGGAGGSSIGRSLSCSGKVFLSRYTRRRNSLLPS